MREQPVQPRGQPPRHVGGEVHERHDRSARASDPTRVVSLCCMREIAPGLWHWTARHEHIHMDVSSYYLLAERVLIDAKIPPAGLEWFDTHGRPEHVLLTNRHHDRDAWLLRDAFGCTVHCIRNGPVSYTHLR